MTEKNKIKTAVIKCSLLKCLFKKIDKIKEKNIKDDVNNWYLALANLKIKS